VFDRNTYFNYYVFNIVKKRIYMTTHVVFDGESLPENIRVSAVIPRTPHPETIDELTRKVELDIDPGTMKSAFFETVDISFQGGKPGESHHAYIDVDDGQFKVDGKPFMSGESVDGIKIDHSPGRRR